MRNRKIERIAAATMTTAIFTIMKMAVVANIPMDKLMGMTAGILAVEAMGMAVAICIFMKVSAVLGTTTLILLIPLRVHTPISWWKILTQKGIPKIAIALSAIRMWNIAMYVVKALPAATATCLMKTWKSAFTSWRV